MRSKIEGRSMFLERGREVHLRERASNTPPANIDNRREKLAVAALKGTLLNSLLLLPSTWERGRMG